MLFLIRIWIFFLCLIFLTADAFCFSLFGKGYLVKINGKEYSEEDFYRWWKFWRSDDQTLDNSTIQEFIDWILLSDQAKAMGLEEEASYKHKLRVFLKVRSLLQLRYEEVGRKIKMDKDNLWEFYREKFAPVLKIKAIMSDNESEIEAIASQVDHSPTKFMKFFKSLSESGKAKDLGWRRPMTIPSDLREKILKAKEGNILGPFKHGRTWMIVYVEKREEPNGLDFKRIHATVVDVYRKYMEDRLTKRLVDRLKEKYGVRVHRDVLAAIGLQDLPEDLRKRTVIEVGNSKITAEEFQSILEKEADLRLRSSKDRNKLEELKSMIVNTMVAQTLIDMEALSRHYEKGPLKDLYWFYRRNRLIKELEEKILWPQVKVSDQEVKVYYEKHIKDFTKPKRVEIAVIQTRDERLARSVYKRIKSGEDFFDVARDVMFHGAVPRRFAVDSLVPPMREALKGMAEGDVSGIIRYKEWFFIVKLIKRYPEEVHPYSKVKDSIRKSLAEKRFLELRNKYLKKLRERSDIIVNWNRWRDILRKGEGK